ncbi:nucleosome assembly protein 1-like 1 [Teleopsis dalmanni]
MEGASSKKSEDKCVDKKAEGGEDVTLDYFSASERRNFLHGMVKSLPTSLQNRLTVLKNMQIEHLDFERQLYEDIFNVERKYHEKLIPLYNKRKEIVSGALEPKPELPKWKDSEKNYPETPLMNDYCNILKMYKNANEKTKGLPNFWLTIFKTSDRLSDFIYVVDEPLLSKLNDITIDYSDLSYTIGFHFDENEYIHNSVLTKQYFLKKTVDKDFPFSYDGPDVTKSVGCKIDWKEGKNLTLSRIENIACETGPIVVPTASFFHFFNPPQIAEEEMDEDAQLVMFKDFELGQFIRDELIPRAVLFFTGDYFEDVEQFTDEESTNNSDECGGDECDGNDLKPA